MNKQAFLDEVKTRLEGLDESEINEAISFYAEAIDDRTDDGMSEEEAIADIGSPEFIANEILLDKPITKLIKARTDKKRQSLEAWEIVLIILSSPLWATVLVVVLSVLFSIYITLWALVISLVATIVALILGGLGIAIMALTGLFTSSGLNTMGVMGLGILCCGIGLALVIPVKWACIGLFRLMKAFIRWIKKLFIRK